MNLPIIESCDDCCACCMEMGNPPAYIAIIMGGPERWPVKEDLQRVASLPEEAMRILNDHVIDCEEEPSLYEGPCCWLDQDARRCRFYEHRPSICRDFERSSPECHGWREERCSHE